MKLVYLGRAIGEEKEYEARMVVGMGKLLYVLYILYLFEKIRNLPVCSNG